MTDEAVGASESIKKKFPDFHPEIALVLGSGLSQLSQHIKNPQIIPYESLPGFSRTTVEGHCGEFVLGELEGKSIVCMRGRLHLYEGAPIKTLQTMVRTCHLLGCRVWVATNAAGSLRPESRPGDLMLINDHINFQFHNPLVGINDERFGPRFVSLENAYDRELREHLLSVAATLKIPLLEGVYLGVLGPSFETPAEIKAYRILGADLVGMSTVSEVILARHCGMRVVGISVITNLAVGLHPVDVTHSETLKGAAMGAKKLVPLVQHFIKTCVVSP